MTEREEKLVQVHQARDEWEGRLLIGYLEDNGIEASLRERASVPPLDGAEELMGGDKVLGILVLEPQGARARELLQEFQSAVTDDTLLADTAAQQLKVSRETIQRLRGELREEKKTFEALGWIVIVFCGAAALLWAIWPAWLKVAAPAAGLRWVMVFLLVAGAIFAGNWANKRM